MLLLGALLVAAHCLAMAAARAAETNRPTLYVAPLQGEKGMGFWQPAIGEGLAEMFITELSGLGKFEVLESTALESVKDYVKLGQDGWIEANEKVEKGHWNGADYMFVGKITRFGNRSKSFGGGGIIPIPGGFGVSRNESEVEMVWRLVDMNTTTIVRSGKSTGKKSGTSWGFAGGLGGGFVRDREFLDSALGKATSEAISNIISQVRGIEVGPGTRAKLRDARAAAKEKAALDEAEKLRATPGVVEAVGPGFVVASIGSKHGIKAGDKLKLFEVTEVKNKEGKVVFQEEKPAGDVTAESVQEERGKFRVAGSVTPKEGWLVRAAGGSLAGK